jgi:hypothetical protein
MIVNVFGYLLSTRGCRSTRDYVEERAEKVLHQGIGSGNIENEKDTFDFGERCEDVFVLGIVGIGGIREGG